MCNEAQSSSNRAGAIQGGRPEMAPQGHNHGYASGSLGTLGTDNVQQRTATQQVRLAESAARPTAKSLILERVGKMREQAYCLERLAHALPGELPRDADEALFDLVIAARVGR